MVNLIWSSGRNGTVMTKLLVHYAVVLGVAPW